MVSVKRNGVSDVDIIQCRMKTSHVELNEQLNKHIHLPSPFQSNTTFNPPRKSTTNQYRASEPLEHVKKQIPHEEINNYTSAFLQQYLQEILYQDPSFQNMLQHRLVAINSVCWEMVNFIADQVVYEIVSERLRITKTVSFYLITLESIAVDLINEVVKSELLIIGTACISHFDALREHEKMYQLLGWHRWRYCLKRNKFRIFLKQKNAEELLLNLKGFSAVTPKKSKRMLYQNTPATTQLTFQVNSHI